MASYYDDMTLPFYLNKEPTSGFYGENGLDVQSYIISSDNPYKIENVPQDWQDMEYENDRDKYAVNARNIIEGWERGQRMAAGIEGQNREPLPVGNPRFANTILDINGNPVHPVAPISQPPMMPIPQRAMQPRSYAQMMLDNPGAEAGGFGRMMPLPNPATAGSQNQLAMNMAAQLPGVSGAMLPSGTPVQLPGVHHGDYWEQKLQERALHPIQLATAQAGLQHAQGQVAMMPIDMQHKLLNLNTALATAPYEIQRAAQNIALGNATMEEHNAVAAYRLSEAARQKQDWLAKSAMGSAMNQAAMEQHENIYATKGMGNMGSLSPKNAADIRERWVARMVQAGHDENDVRDAYDTAYHNAVTKRNANYLSEAQKQAAIAHSVAAAGRAEAQTGDINRKQQIAYHMNQAGWFPQGKSVVAPGYGIHKVTAEDGSVWEKPVKITQEKPEKPEKPHYWTQTSDDGRTKTQNRMVDIGGQSYRLPISTNAPPFSVDYPQAGTGAGTAQKPITMTNPQGQSVVVPPNRIEEARKLGYK